MSVTAENSKNAKRRSNLLKRTAQILLGESITISYVFCTVIFGLSTASDYRGATMLLAMAVVGYIVFTLLIITKKKPTERYSITINWLQFFYWLPIFAFLVILTGESRSICLVFAFASVIYLLAETRLTQSIIVAFLLYCFYLATSVYAISVLGQGGSVSLEIINSMGFLLMVIFVTYVANRWANYRRSLLQSKKALEEANIRLKNMDNQKTLFFQNITHEIRTPLTLILGPLGSAASGELDEHPEELKRHLRIALRNGRRLLRLINQILDISKIEAGGMTLHLETVDIVTIIKNIKNSFWTLAEQKGINLKFISGEQEILIRSDREKLEKIFANILSNAFKFTDRGGEITFMVERIAGSVWISVRDTGLGIPPAELPFIFDRFKQVDGSSTREQEGTGIGLSLVKELVDLLEGAIEVTSLPGSGTEFTIILQDLCRSDVTAPRPAQDDAPPSARDTTIQAAAVETIAGIEGELSQFYEKEEPVHSPGMHDHLPCVLVVEDNPDMRSFIRHSLLEKFRIIEAGDGEEGLTLARQYRPDVIVSDLMMPKMNGNQLLEAVRREEGLSHVPFIVVTAKASEDMKIGELEAGADDYISKPFNPRELVARISNLWRIKDQEKQLSLAHERLNAAYSNMKRDLQLARLIQERIMPRYITGIKNLTFQIAYMPLIEIGGDLYDVTEFPDGIARIFLSDATGHGVMAALGTMLIKSEYEKVKLAERDPSRVLSLLNDVFCSLYRDLQVFFTGIIVDLDLTSGTMTYSSAGHPVQYILSGNDIIDLAKTGRAVGVLPDLNCRSVTLPFRSGDRLFLFTDGIFEEFNNLYEEYGERRLREFISGNTFLPSEELLSSLIHHVMEFVDETINDDICMIIINNT